MSRLTEIKKYIESFNSSEAHYAFGYIKGYHNIKDKEVDK